MSLENTETYLTSLISAGADMMTNLYYIEFIPASADLNVEGVNLTVRAKNFKAPAASQPTHTVDFMTTSMALPSPGVDITKSFDLTFRVDSNYQVYQYLKSWQNKNVSGSFEFASNAIPDEQPANKGYQVNVYAMSGRIGLSHEKYTEGTFIKDRYKKQLYNFRYCWVSSVSGLDYSYSSTDPQEVTATIKFADYSGPEDFLNPSTAS